MSAREFLTALTELYVGPDAAEITTATTSGFTEADWAGADAWRHEAWPGDAPIDLPALAAAGFPKAVVVGGYDPAAHAIAAKFAAAGHLRALQAERHALARRINGRLVTFSGSMHAPQAEEPDAFNGLLRDIWRAARAAADCGDEPGTGAMSPGLGDESGTGR